MANPSQSLDIIVGRNLSRLRVARGMTQTDLGNALAHPIRAQQVSKFELGENQVGATRLWELSLIFGCALGEFFVGVGNESATPMRVPSRGEVELMVDYQDLPNAMQSAVRALVHNIAKELRYVHPTEQQ